MFFKTRGNFVINRLLYMCIFLNPGILGIPNHKTLIIKIIALDSDKIPPVELE